MNTFTHFLPLSAGLGILLSSVVAMSALSQNTQNDDTEIKSLVKTMEEGWAKKDGKLFAKPFAENADYVVVNGRHIKGKAGIAASHQQIFDTFYKETLISTTVENIRYLKPDIAIAHCSGSLTGNVYGKAINNQSRITLMLMKEAGKWEVQAFQNTEIVNQNGPQRPTND